MTTDATENAVIGKAWLPHPQHLEKEQCEIDLERTVKPDLNYDVVCGRGKGSYNRPGNKRFRSIVGEHIPAYQATRNKNDKGYLLNTIIAQVKAQNHGRARFIKPVKGGGWTEISMDAAREKVGHAIREAIGSREMARGKEQAHKIWERKQAELLSSQQAIFEQLMAECDDDDDGDSSDHSRSSSGTSSRPANARVASSPTHV